MYTKIKLFQGMQFLGTIPDNYDEQNGLDFLWHKDWQRIDEEISQSQELHGTNECDTSQENEDVPALVATPTLAITPTLVATTKVHPEAAAIVVSANVQVEMLKATHQALYSPQNVWTRRLGQI
jgi:hypothetical protein